MTYNQGAVSKSTFLEKKPHKLHYILYASFVFYTNFLKMLTTWKKIGVDILKVSNGTYLGLK